MRLEGKVALITGAASGVQGELMGFGGATARLFAREGAKVVLSDILVESGEKTSAQIREAGGEALFVRLDVTSEQDWIDAIRTTVSTFGGLDIVVNNAGTSAAHTVEEMSVEVWDGLLAVHAKGVFLGTKHAIPEMRKAGGGSIINISSIMGLVGSPSSAAYSAAKGAIRIFTKAAAVQYAGEKIRVNSVHPGFCDTPLTESRFFDPDYREWLLGRIPAGVIGTADDIAHGVLYLASDEARWVTGSELVIDGGTTAE
jgi:NAD(P)-dependent dehydrogenase (short-subunit alcohol dehydrogenase family)